jgi:hypothetical protein
MISGTLAESPIKEKVGDASFSLNFVCICGVALVDDAVIDNEIGVKSADCLGVEKLLDIGPRPDQSNQFLWGETIKQRLCRWSRWKNPFYGIGELNLAPGGVDEIACPGRLQEGSFESKRRQQ